MSQNPNNIIHTKDCPYCKTSPLEVFIHIIKTAEGIFDEKGNLKTETHDEEITSIECSNCKKQIPISIIKNWR